jgi:hypothetical protein
VKLLQKFIAFFLISLLIQWIFKFEWYFSNTILLFVFFVYEFVVNLGKRIVFLEFLAALAVLQWLLGPLGYYLFLGDSLFFAFKMMIGPDEYFNFVFPATIMLIAGIYIPIRNLTMDHRAVFVRIKEYLSDKPKTGLVLVFIGIISSLSSSFVPPSLAFVFFLLKDMMYVGALYLFFSPFKGKKIVLGVVTAFILFQSINQGMFKELIFWMVFFVIFLTFVHPVSLRRKMVLSVFLALTIGILQSVKGEYRLATWDASNKTESKSSILWSLVKSNINNPQSVFLSKSFMEQNIHRLNQGALISHVVYHTPDKVPYARGSTISSAVLGSIVPRFLWSNKRTADQELFEKYSGIELARGTSMDLSPLGEAYANFGKPGAVIFMLFYGLIIGYVFFLFLRYSSTAPTVILWLPMVFYQVLAVESDLFKVLNSLTKGSILVLLAFLVFRKMFKAKI